MIPKFSFDELSGELSVRPTSGQFSCIRYISQGKLNPLHYHNNYSLVLILSGRLDAVNCGYPFSGEAPILSLTAPFMPHTVHAWEDTEYDRYVFYATKELMERYAPQVVDMSRLEGSNWVWARPDAAALERITLLMQELAITENNDSAALLLAVCMQILLSEVDAGRGEIVKMPHPYIHSVLRDLAESIDAPPTIEEVCRRLGISRSKFLRDFKTVTSTTWHRYITDIRMKRAVELLQDGQSILQTSLECGYSTESHFIMAYHKYFGETPGGFLSRRSHGSGQP